MKPKNIQAISVDVDQSDDQHHEFTIWMMNLCEVVEADTCHLYNGVTQADLWRAAEQGAGFVARIGVWAVPFVELEAQQHGCRDRQSVTQNAEEGPNHAPRQFDTCSVGAPWTTLRPLDDYGNPPAVWINVPSNRVKHWRGLIGVWLKALADEQAQGWQQPSTPFDLDTNVRELRRA